jgi:hypothetical protein
MYNIRLKANLFAGGIFHKGDFNIAIKGAIGSAP